MIWFFGTKNYGKVDHVPGLFYVVTAFFYVQFIPLVPTGSYLVIDDGHERGFKLGLSGKSVLFAYLRAALILGGPVAMLLGVYELHKNSVAAVVMIVAGMFAIILFFLSYKLAKPSAARALRLAGAAGIPPEYVAQFFVHSDAALEGLATRQYDEVLPADEHDADNRNR